MANYSSFEYFLKSVADVELGLLGSWRMVDPVSQELQKYMDLVATRQKLVAANIANIDTPDYHTRDIDFQEEFQNSLRGEEPRTIEVPNLKIKNDGNDVNLDRETRLLSENALRFRMASGLLKDKFSMMKQAIQGEKS